MSLDQANDREVNGVKLPELLLPGSGFLEVIKNAVGQTWGTGEKLLDKEQQSEHGGAVYVKVEGDTKSFKFGDIRTDGNLDSVTLTDFKAKLVPSGPATSLWLSITSIPSPGTSTATTRQRPTDLKEPVTSTLRFEYKDWFHLVMTTT